MQCYRVVVFNKSVHRKFPLFTNWTTVSLRDRQAQELDDGGFGDGMSCDPIVTMVEDDAGPLSEIGTNPQPEEHQEELRIRYEILVKKEMDEIVARHATLLKDY